MDFKPTSKPDATVSKIADEAREDYRKGIDNRARYRSSYMDYGNPDPMWGHLFDQSMYTIYSQAWDAEREKDQNKNIGKVLGKIDLSKMRKK